jgi:cbb3-type cytochrome oxidase subunit 3
MTFGAFATLLVALAFAGLLGWVLYPANRSRFESYGMIPLDDDGQPVERRKRRG